MPRATGSPWSSISFPEQPEEGHRAQRIVRRDATVERGIDGTALARIQRIGGAKLVVKVIDAFLESAPGRLARARQAITDRNPEEVVAVLHSLVSSAGQLGARQLETLATDGQRRVQANGIEAATEVLQDVEAAYAEAETGLRKAREDLAP